MYSDSQLLTIWERGYSTSLLGRAVLLASLASPELTPDQVMDMSIGQRDGRLMRLRKDVFGTQVNSTAACPHCQAKMELSFDLNSVLDSASRESNDTVQIEWEQQSLRFRCPSTRDLVSILQSPEPSETSLMKRCLAEDHPEHAAFENSDFQHSVSTLIEAHDPLGHVEFHVDCTDCVQTFSTTFDIVSFLWAELNAWSQRLMGEIHVLAQSYGWREAEILSLGSWRRQVYLNMIRQ